MKNWKEVIIEERTKLIQLSKQDKYKIAKSIIQKNENLSEVKVVIKIVRELLKKSYARIGNKFKVDADDRRISIIVSGDNEPLAGDILRLLDIIRTDEYYDMADNDDILIPTLKNVSITTDKGKDLQARY